MNEPSSSSLRQDDITSKISNLEKAVEDSKQIAQNKIQSLAKWMFVSLFALNAGGVLATISAEQYLQNAGLIGGLFLAALSLSFIAACFLLLHSIAELIFVVAIEQVVEDWQGKRAEFSEKGRNKFRRKLHVALGRLQQSIVLLWFPGLSFALSILFSVAAVITFYVDFGSRQKKLEPFCAKLEAEMVSAHPRRSNGPDVFQALGCRPQGWGSVYASLAEPKL